MTLNGVFRELAAAERRAARAAERRQRVEMRAAKLRTRMDDLAHAAAEVDEFDERIRQLAGIHREVGEAMDWTEVLGRPQPPSPTRLSRCEMSAAFERDSYRPTFWQRFFGGEAKRRAELEALVLQGRKSDDDNYRMACHAHERAVEKWSAVHSMAAAIVGGEVAMYSAAFAELMPLAEIEEIGARLVVSFPDPKTTVVVFQVEDAQVVPKEIKSLTRAGKLSIKTMPQGRFYELYQDYVCGCALRAAREFFSFLPLSRVIVNIEATLLDSATGHLRPRAILSVGMPRITIEQINFSTVDASDAMSLFPHRMGFKRSRGFSAVDPLTQEEWPAVSS